MTLLDPFLLILIILIAALTFIVLALAPLVIELKMPRDKGPRQILKKSLDRRIRSRYEKPVTIGQCSPSNSNMLRNLQDVLDQADVRAIRIGKDTTRIFGNVVFSPCLEASDNILVEGTLSVGDYCVFHRSVKAKGNVHIGNGVTVKGNLISEGDLTILDETVIGGSVHSEGSVKIGEKVFIASSVVAVGDVELYENSEVKKNILTRGVIKVVRHPKVDLPSTIDEIG